MQPAKRSSNLVVVVAILAANVVGQAVEPSRNDASGSNASIDELLGKHGKGKHADHLAALKIDGKTYSWDKYADWGRELFHNSQVESPPTGAAPSPKLSKFYRCIDCHNDCREDDVLTEQDPDTRYFRIERLAKKNGNADGLRMAPGTTLWGAVNRESFYNDSYEIYHGLDVADGEVMDPTSLEDACQVCCRYCSVGRFAEAWEIASIMTYLWDLELTLDDLNLPTNVSAELLRSLRGGSKLPDEDAAKASQLIRNLICRKAKDRYTHPPEESNEEEVGPYPDKLIFVGDATIGKNIYLASCDQCHGEGKVCETTGADLIGDPEYFHEILSFGTARDDAPYMPMFTAQRLSRQQIADIATYLHSLD